MISHKVRLLFLACGMSLLTTGIARGEIIKSCDLITQAKKEGAINPHLVLAISQVESSLNSKAVSRQGRSVHYGLMQLKPATARLLGFRGPPHGLLQWKTNVKYGVRYLNEKMMKYNSKQAAAAAYNAGAAFICRRGVKCDLGDFVNQSYVDLVMDRYRKVRRVQCS